jgi:hypothetical protein
MRLMKKAGLGSTSHCEARRDFAGSFFLFAAARRRHCGFVPFLIPGGSLLYIPRLQTVIILNSIVVIMKNDAGEVVDLYIPRKW